MLHPTSTSGLAIRIWDGRNKFRHDRQHHWGSASSSLFNASQLLLSVLFYFRLAFQSVWPNVGIKIAQFYQMLPKNSLSSFNFTSGIYQKSPKSHVIIGLLFFTFYCLELSKIAQSGHTDFRTSKYSGKLYKLTQIFRVMRQSLLFIKYEPTQAFLVSIPFFLLFKNK